jgi:hypothetical protein
VFEPFDTALIRQPMGIADKDIVLKRRAQIGHLLSAPGIF